MADLSADSWNALPLQSLIGGEDSARNSYWK